MFRHSDNVKSMFTYIAIILWAVIIISVGTVAIYKKVKNLTYQDLCPEYFQAQYAYVVDKSGNGIDSVLVTMKDNSNFNKIYQSFTDKDGRFLLFNDFYSFSLYRTPISYELQLFIDGYSDTVIYTFKKNRICHFEKVSGPDTIRITPDKEKYDHVIPVIKSKNDSCYKTITANSIIQNLDSCLILSGMSVINSDTFRINLIDRADNGFKNKEMVSIVVDCNADGKIDYRKGSMEYFETASRPIILGEYSFMIDRFSENGKYMLLKYLRFLEKPYNPKTEDSFIENLKLPVTSVISVNDIMKNNDYLILYFLSDNYPDIVKSKEIKTLLHLMNKGLGKTEIIGINRSRSNRILNEQKIVDEAKGWEGPVVMQLRNEMEKEIICINRNRKILYRGIPNRKAVQTIWESESEKLKETALKKFDSMQSSIQIVK